MPQHAASQQGPRPLPLFLALVGQETADDPARRAAALAGLAAYQRAPRPAAPPPRPAVATAGRASLRSAGAGGRPVVLVPSLINPPSVLDLPGRSLLAWLATQGFRPLLVDWGRPDPADRDLDLAAHVERLLLPMLATLTEPPVLVGYCLGGTLAIAAAALMPVRGLATIAAPWRFAGYGDARAAMVAAWKAAEPACAALGLAPVELFQAGFWQLDPARTVAKFEAFGRLPPDGDAARAFVALEDWANGGDALPAAAARDVFDRFVDADAPGRGAWQVADTAIDPFALRCPTVEFVAAGDRIVPAATAVGWPDRRDVAAGHVGMIVGRRARAQLWSPLAQWIEGLG